MNGDPYRTWASLYDLLLEPGEKLVRKIGLAVFPPRDNLSILDIGCGTGTQLALYRRADCKLHGVDISPAMLAKAKSKLGDTAELTLQNASRLNFPGQMFDLVFAILVVHETPASLRPAVLAECQRVTKADGRIMVIDWHVGPYKFPRGYIWRPLRRLIEFSGGRQHYTNYCDFKRRGGMEPLIEETHLSVDKRLVDGILTFYLLKP